LTAQRTANRQGNAEQKEQHWRYHNTQLQTILKSHTNKNSIVLAQKQIWRPVKQSRRLRYESTPTWFFTKVPETHNGEKDSLFNKYCWEKCISACNKLKLDPHFSPCANIISKWFKVLSIKPKILNLVQERAWNSLELKGIGMTSKIELKWLRN
jgi:hypothetical protein